MATQVQQMARTIDELTASGKGILAADESPGTLEKRFNEVNAPCTEQTRREYRELLFSTTRLGDYISGGILHVETLKQSTAAGVPITQLLTSQGIVPGRKVDIGTVPLPGFPGEKLTQGLDGLAQRLREYQQLGARFAKWRAVIGIGAAIPTPQMIEANAYTLAQYASLCQQQGLLPIVEPEVLMEGDHSLAVSARVTGEVLQAVFHALYRQRVALEYILLKPNMVAPGTSCPQQAALEQVAEATLICLRRNVPAAVPGVFFLSGGQTDTVATANLNAINARPDTQPWVLSFSFGRALQAPALNAWRGDPQNRSAAQNALHRRARLNSAAQAGKYSSPMEIT